MKKQRQGTKSALERRVRTGLEKLAFGDITDAVRLLLLEDAGVDAATGLDLFNVAELKHGKNGFEVKFFDRFRAMEALARLAENDSRAANVVPFFEALARGAGEGDKDDA